MRLIAVLKAYIQNKEEEPTLDWLLDNLINEDITNQQRLKTWNKRQAVEDWDFGNPKVVESNLDMFLRSYTDSLLCKKHKYYLMVKKINYTNSTVTLVFKNGLDLRIHTFHLFDLERVLRGCSEVIGAETETRLFLNNEAKKALSRTETF